MLLPISNHSPNNLRVTTSKARLETYAVIVLDYGSNGHHRDKR